jgi:serine phosphatase RsbU (regulator of sigma subunit)
VVALRIRSVVCAPLVGRSGKPLGVIQLHSEGKTRPFTQEDLDVLASTAHAAALAVENARLHEEHLAQAKIARDLELAREVQRGFLPSEWPRLSGYGFYSYYEPARSVGGDYYGFVALPDERLVIALGDVSGKGVPAALMMARLSSDIRFAALSEPDPAAAVGLVNRSMGESGLSDRFVTLVYMVVDSRSHRLSVVNAGHMPPIVRHADGSIEEIGDPEVGLPLNVSPDPDYRFESAATELEPGSTVLVYTDGVSEAANPGGEMFGMDRVRAVFAGAGGDAVAAGEAVVGAARDFAAGAPQGDDVTVVCFARNPA